MTNIPLLVFMSEALLELVCVAFVKGKTARLASVLLLLPLMTFATTSIVIESPSVATAALAVVGVFRGVNLFRFGYGRTEPHYLRMSALRSTVRLLALQAISFVTIYVISQYALVLMFVAILLAVFSAIVFLQTTHRLKRVDLPSIMRPQATKDLPVVSVAIPARNETQDLAECIESVLASDYPKLEVLVYDDCSQDKTPEVIRSFAHEGVRFLGGSEPESSWLARNAAYNMLANEALGDYILFCGVDLRFEPTAISSMVASMQQQKLKMISVLPHRDRDMKYALFYQSARYFWELALPRQFVHRPPALSSCWMVDKQLLNKSGFNAVARSAMPERYFAWKAEKQNAYRFLSARNLALVYSRKSLEEQRITAIRLRYPQLRKRPENVALYYMLAIAAVGMPAVLIVLAAFGKIGLELGVLGIAAILLLNMTNALIISVVSPNHALVAALIFPVVVVVDLGSLFVSMARYEFGTVDWKGRNICMPLMHIVPKLPDIDSK